MEYHPVQCKFMQTPLAQQNGVFLLKLLLQLAVALQATYQTGIGNRKEKLKHDTKG